MVGAIELLLAIWIHGYFPICLILSFGFLGRLAKFFVLEYTENVGLRSEFRYLGGQFVGLRSQKSGLCGNNSV